MLRNNLIFHPASGILFFVFCILPVLTFSQDTLTASKPFTHFIDEKSFDKGTYSVIDTSLDNYHYYLPGFYHNYKTLGNSGSPAQSMYFSPVYITGFNSGINFLDAYTSKKEEILYYNTRRPHSKILFLMGSKEEQILKAQHTQNIGKQFNFGFNYTNINSKGFYQRQENKLNDFNFHTSFQTKNNRYGNFANFIYDKMDVQENGGLAAEYLFEENIEERKDALPVNLSNASNLFKKKSYYLKQYFNFGNKEEIFDAKDSITRKVVSPFLRLAHTFSFEKNIYSYKDPIIDSGDSLFYLSLFNYDSIRIPIDTVKDSINIKIYENTFSLSTIDFTDLYGKPHGLKNIYASVWVKHQNISRLTHNDNFDTTFQNIIVGADVRYRFLKMFSLGGNASLVTSGFNRSDHYYNGFLEFAHDSSSHSIKIASYHQIKHPDWIFTRYFSDQFSWHYDFLNSSYSGQSISYHNEKWKIIAGFSQNFIKNFLYFDFGDIYADDTIFVAHRIISKQRTKGRTGINQAYLGKKLKLWKFHLNTNIYYQQTSNDVILPLPEIITYNSFYYENFMLRKSIYGQIGFDFYYHTGYYANAYMPLLRVSYLQNDKVIGNYPFLDFFINFKIKSVRAFFKITHLNSGSSGNTYYLVPGYPQPDRAFRFGIDWRFLD